jgi:hypothetical protein
MQRQTDTRLMIYKRRPPQYTELNTRNLILPASVKDQPSLRSPDKGLLTLLAPSVSTDQSRQRKQQRPHHRRVLHEGPTSGLTWHPTGNLQQLRCKCRSLLGTAIRTDESVYAESHTFPPLCTYAFDTALEPGVQRADFGKPFSACPHISTHLLEDERRLCSCADELFRCFR